METLKKFRLAVVRYTLVLTLGGAGALWLWDTAASKGLLMGGLAGAIGFWITGRNVQQLASPGADKLQYYAFKWTFVRLFFYALAITRAYTLDREQYHGLIAAVVGIFLVQLVMIALAFTTLGDSGREEA